MVKVARAVDAVRRKPEEYEHITFFSRYNAWVYEAVLDGRLCERCLEFEQNPYFFGTELRSNFPYLEIQDENTILAWVHPNCRCRLHRITEWTPDLLKWYLEYAGVS